MRETVFGAFRPAALRTCIRKGVVTLAVLLAVCVDAPHIETNNAQYALRHHKQTNTASTAPTHGMQHSLENPGSSERNQKETKVQSRCTVDKCDDTKPFKKSRGGRPLAIGKGLAAAGRRAGRSSSVTGERVWGWEPERSCLRVCGVLPHFETII